MPIYTRDNINYGGMLQAALQNKANYLKNRYDRVAQMGKNWGDAVANSGKVAQDAMFKIAGNYYDQDKIAQQQQFQASEAEKRVHDINPDCNITAVCDWLDRDTVGLLSEFRPDCVVDAVDRVTAKLIIIEWCRENGVHVISSMGTGNRIDAESFRIGDISDTAGCGCPLSRIMRRELRARGILSLDVLYAQDPPARSGDRTPASISFVPPVAGYLIAGHAVRHFLGL
jgi:tRNA A37 threonylcarbamoyladenosine dehydratase